MGKDRYGHDVLILKEKVIEIIDKHLGDLK